MGIFDSYSSSVSFDEMFDSEQNVRDYWKDIFNDIESGGFDTLKKKQDDIDWQLEDNCVTYNTYSEGSNSSRSWSLDPIPFIISESEWETIQKGLQQRAKLLNLILKDLYSDQKLIKENIIPAEVVFGHKGFITEVYDFGYKENFNLYFYATDMARGPDGKMWVINDKTQAPSGLGYTIENRLTMNVIAEDLYPNVKTKKLSPFIEEFKALLYKLTDGDISTAALLTPGPYNETYFEHAYLSSFLEINLLQGDDLLSKDGALWLKSLGGLKKINTILRRVDDRFSDPLELRSDSRLGVAGMVDAMRQENLNMINPIGSSILENKGLNPFMHKISEYFLKEELILPQIATWWCGQKKELDFVLKNLSKLVIKKIDKTDIIKTYFGKDLSTEELDNLSTLLIESPNKYIAQEEISFSTTPFYSDGKIEPRNAVIRTFCLKKDDDYSVMHGGLVRVSAIKDTLMVSSKQGGTSKDLWILTSKEEEINQNYILNRMQYVDTAIENISTLRAENLFWLGRYISRSIHTTRFIILIVKQFTNLYRYEVRTESDTQDILQKALTHFTMTYPGFLNNKNNVKNPMPEILSVIKDASRSGSLSFAISMLSSANINLKDLLAVESSKLFDKIKKDWNGFVVKQSYSKISVLKELDKLLIHLMAYKELVRESIFKEQGLILYDIGYKIESAVILISKSRSMLCLKLDKSVSYDILEGMLNSMESMNAYRAQYKSSLILESVIEFLILNRQFPKSLAYITNKLLSEFKLLPKSKEYLTPYEIPIFEANKFLESLNIEDIMQIKDDDVIYAELDKILSKLSDYFTECSNEFSKTYFSHYDE